MFGVCLTGGCTGRLRIELLRPASVTRTSHLDGNERARGHVVASFKSK